MKIGVIRLGCKKSRLLVIYNNIKLNDMDTDTKFQDWNNNNKEDTAKIHKKTMRTAIMSLIATLTMIILYDTQNNSTMVLT